MGYFFVILGVIALVVGITEKEFYVDGFEGADFKPPRRVRVWLGRLVFTLVGVSFVALGVKMIFESN